MIEDKIITTDELSKYGLVGNLNEQAVALVQQQKTSWELAGKNYAALAQVQTKQFDFGHFHIHAHHNPGRMRSSAALTDHHTIARRPCFLCADNLPAPQKGIPFPGNYLILTNPFPIFPVHLTIPLRTHEPQQLKPYFGDMLNLSRELPGFTLFYNGPRCGASAPDHFHFQAVKRDCLAIEKEWESNLKISAEAVFQQKDVGIYAVGNCLRRFFALVSPHKHALIRAFRFLYSSLPEKDGIEPMMNVLAWYEKKDWTILVFPRQKQRPCHFFQTGSRQIIIGPAAVEMGGHLILPRQEDFLKIDCKFITEMYDEVSVSSEYFKLLIEKLKQFR